MKGISRVLFFSSNLLESIEYIFNWLWVYLKIFLDNFGVIHWGNQIKMIHLLMPDQYKTKVANRVYDLDYC